ncbi:hypothetical protein [Nocardia arthritidis]|uniref:Phage tail assembly protein n=1 Tax=Nocardia arthritidis TaxID=228602 RepID=A0A6G9YTN8_9NOCA|nr:hypothetical protein [Nocardia arthritidis]QIS16578.1 hypothetical protein F5544_43875 [Nocardia arthritidis]
MTSPKAPITLNRPIQVKDDFVHRVGSVELRLPSLSYLKPGLVRRIRRLGDVDAMYTLLELTLSADALAVLDEMDPEEYHELLEAWRIHSGVGLGES